MTSRSQCYIYFFIFTWARIPLFFSRRIYYICGRVGLVVRALAFHQCGPGSISALGVTCGLSLLVLYSVMRGFSPGTPVFPSHQKPTFDLIWFVNNNSKNSDLGNVDLISSTIVKRNWSCSYANLRYRNIKHYYHYYYYYYYYYITPNQLSEQLGAASLVWREKRADEQLI